MFVGGGELGHFVAPWLIDGGGLLGKWGRGWFERKSGIHDSLGACCGLLLTCLMESVRRVLGLVFFLLVSFDS